LEEATEKVEQGEAVLIDVRSRASYEKSHAVGAISIPEPEVDARLAELPRDKELVLY
jgi:rhodanese-related sulfurtransferase